MRDTVPAGGGGPVKAPQGGGQTRADGASVPLRLKTRQLQEVEEVSAGAESNEVQDCTARAAY